MPGGKKVPELPAPKVVRDGWAYLVFQIWDYYTNTDGGRDPETEGGG